MNSLSCYMPVINFLRRDILIFVKFFQYFQYIGAGVSYKDSHYIVPEYSPKHRLLLFSD